MRFTLLVNGKPTGQGYNNCRAYVQDNCIGLPPNKRVGVSFGSSLLNTIKEKLNAVEKEMGFTPTVFENHTYGYMLLSDERWMRCPPMISLYTLILRLFWRGFSIENWKILIPNESFKAFSDYSEFLSIKKYIPLFLQHLDELFPNDSCFTIFEGHSTIWHNNGVNFLLYGFRDYGWLNYLQRQQFVDYIGPVNKRWEEIKNEI